MSNDSAKFTVRRAQTTDFDQIVNLQMRNLGTNLTEEQRNDGFLSGYFDAEALAAANENLCVLVWADSTEVSGFVCLTTPAFKHHNEVAAAMLEKVSQDKIFGREFEAWNVCLCGPVCIERERRGMGLFERLYEQIPRFAVDCDLLACLISITNSRSIAAHQKVGMEAVSEFEWNRRRFYVMAKKVDRSSGQCFNGAYPKIG